MLMRRLDASDSGFDTALAQLLQFATQRDPATGQRVADIISGVRQRGDQALLEYTNAFDQRRVVDVSGLEIDAAQMQRALQRLPVSLRDALHAAAARIESYHQRQRQESWQYHDADGTLLGQRITALDRVRGLRARRQGQLPLVGADELHSGPGRRCRRDRDDCTRAAR
jgi:histidinol dehydrogenase